MGIPSAARAARLRSLSQSVTRLASRGRHEAAHAEATRLLRLDPRVGWAYFYRAGLGVVIGRPAADVLADLQALSELPAERLFASGREPELPGACGGPRVARALAALMVASPRSAWLRTLVAYSRRLDEDWEGAARAMEKAIALAPRDASLRALAARVFYANRLPRRSVRELERAQRLAPGCFWINAWLGEVRRYNGAMDEAHRLLSAALERNPHYFIAYAWRGGVRRILGQHAPALRDLDKALRWEWDGEDDWASMAWALHERSMVKRALGDYEGAIRDLNAAHRLNSRYSWAQLTSRPGQPSRDESLALLDRIMARRPRFAWALAWRGYALASSGRGADARADLDRALALRPGLAWAYAWRAGAALDAGADPRQALQDLDRSIRLDPRYALSRLLRGKLYLRLGQVQRAGKDLARSLALDPFSAAARAELGRAALTLNRFPEAREHLEVALELEPGHAFARYCLDELRRSGR